MEIGDIDIKSLAEKVLATRYDHRDPLPPEPDYLIRIDGKGIALPGSIIGVYGPPKSRKSSLMGMIAAASLSEEGRFGTIESKIKGDILWFDTEQSEMEVQLFQNNVIKMSKVTDDDLILSKYYAMKLRPYDEMERLLVIDKLITAPNLFNNIGLLILDGIADLLYNVNEIEASKKLVTRLTQWADTLNVPLFVPSTIRPYLTRLGQKFLPFMITNDEDTGMPTYYDPNEALADLCWSEPAKKSISNIENIEDALDSL